MCPGPRNFDRLHVYIETIIDDKESKVTAGTLKATRLLYGLDIDLRLVYSYYNNNIWELRYLVFAPRAT